MKADGAASSVSEPNDSLSNDVVEGSLQDGAVVLIPKPSHDPRDPLVRENHLPWDESTQALKHSEY